MSVADGGGAPPPSATYTYDHLFLPGSTNEQVYDAVAAPIVRSAVSGINGVVFAYGQTASGKTHTMLGTAADPGVTARSIAGVFDAVRASPGREFLLRASYIEIYNEVINDLLDGGREHLKVHEDWTGRIYVDARQETVARPADVLALLAAGEKLRAVGDTAMNERSSRSHTVFTLRIESRERRAPPPT
eukprot:contig_12556_g3007